MSAFGGGADIVVKPLRAMKFALTAAATFAFMFIW
jgi:hypothetical protein